MVLVVAIVGLLAVWSSIGYIDTELATGHTTPAGARLFGLLVPLFVAAMLLALLAGNAAVTWVAIEGTTVATAFLVGHRRNRASLEASWKYVIIGSVGISLAFLGTIVLAYAARAAGGTSAQRARLDHTHRARRKAGSRGGAPGGRPAPPRLRHQGRARADAHLAARRAQPGTRAGLRADVGRACSPSRSRCCCASRSSSTPRSAPPTCVDSSSRRRCSHWPSPRR